MEKGRAKENVYQLTLHFVQTPVDHREVHINPASGGPTGTNICAPSCTRPRFTVQSCSGPVVSDPWPHPNTVLLISVQYLAHKESLMLSTDGGCRKKKNPSERRKWPTKEFWREKSENITVKKLHGYMNSNPMDAFWTPATEQYKIYIIPPSKKKVH